MKRALGIPCALAGVLAFASAVSAAPALRVLSADAREVVVEWTADTFEWQTVSATEGEFRRPFVPEASYFAAPGEPDLPSILRLVAIPESSAPVVTVLEVSTESQLVPDLAPAATEGFDTAENGTIRTLSERTRASTWSEGASSSAAWAEASGVTSIRGTRFVRLAVHPFRFDSARSELLFARRVVARVSWSGGPAEPRGAAAADSRDWEEALDDLVLNPAQARAFRSPNVATSRGSGASFSSAPVWLKSKLQNFGFFQVDYFTFANLGFDPAGIDPATVRVFSGRGKPLAEDLQVPRDPFMMEHALLDLGDGDGGFDAGERLLFYALGPNGWSAEYDSLLSRTEHLENPYADETVVWVTWGGSFPTAPRRMSTRSVAPDSTATEFTRALPHRVHFEQNRVDNFRFRDEDGWWWEDLRGRGVNRPYDLLLDRVADGSGTVKVRLGSIEGADEDRFRKVQLKIGGVVLADSTWQHSPQAALVELTGVSANLLGEGINHFRINVDKQAGFTTDRVFVAWFDVEYRRRLDASAGFLHFFSDSSLGVKDYLLDGFDAETSSIHLFDVTDPHGTVLLTDAVVTGVSAPHGVRFSDAPPNSVVRWYCATTPDGVSPLPHPEIAAIRGLRSSAHGAEYVVVHHEKFAAGAARLAALRRDVAVPARTTMAVPIGEIYDEFSWGVTDPTAIRDFFAYALENWSGDSPVFATFLGDASYDSRRFLSGSPENLVPTYTNRYKESSLRLAPLENTSFYSTDDFFGYLEPADYQVFFQPGLDMAIGRYPIQSEVVLDLNLDKLEQYLRKSQPGPWQNRVILVADDERTLDQNLAEAFHTVQVETLARGFIPPSLDQVKIYLTEFPRNDFGKKPEAQAKFIDEFTRGALMVSYTGHGDQNTMSQEEVFVAQKVPELLNESKLPIFSTFSCTVSRFDLLSGSSMCELLVELVGGGAVTTFASGALVFPEPSARLHQQWISAMFGTPYVVGTFAREVRPLGIAALVAKAIVGGIDPDRRNNEKYVLLGDPALEVRFGKTLVQFDSTSVDTQLTDGLLRVIRGSVVDSNGLLLDGTHGPPAFRGTGFVHVTEKADTSGYHYDVPLFNGGTRPDSIQYKLDGPTAFRGEVPVVDGRFEIKFFLSEAIPAGNSARVSVFALEEGLERDGSGAYDRLVIAPTISPGQVSDVDGPVIQIRFEGYEKFVDGDFLFTERPVILIEMEDASGINLRPFPQFARLEAELDGSDRIDLAEDFAYTSGYTRGQVRRIFSLPPGEHSLEVKAFDNVGNRGSVKTTFTIVNGSTDFELVDSAITPYPNPFQDEVDILFRLTQDADVTLKVFTVSGRRIYEDDSIRGLAGDNVIHWNAHDEGGGFLANGTYLYKLEATFLDAKGKVISDDFVGRVVKMR